MKEINPLGDCFCDYTINLYCNSVVVRAVDNNHTNVNAFGIVFFLYLLFIF